MSEDGFVRLPYSILDRGDLSSGEIAVYCALLRFADYESKKCWPARETIGKKAGLSLRSVRDQIEKLEKKGLIKVVYRSGRSNIYKVRTHANFALVGNETHADSARVGCNNCTGSHADFAPEREPLTRSKNENESSSPSSIEKEALNYLNQKAGTKFRYSKASLHHIKARLKENFTIKDLKKVVDSKVVSWGSDPKMSEYLRPSTLFGPKFESYLQAADRDGSNNHERLTETTPSFDAEQLGGYLE
jgi:uncharacterized phage protein (TIGR02220 family)